MVRWRDTGTSSKPPAITIFAIVLHRGHDKSARRMLDAADFGERIRGGFNVQVQQDEAYRPSKI